MSSSCSKLFAAPNAALGPAILQFVPEVAKARVCKAWNLRINELLERWWNVLPERFQAEKEAIEKSCAQEKLSYSQRFKYLDLALTLELQELDPRTAQEMTLRFKGSLSVARIFCKEAKILRLNFFSSKLLQHKQFGKVSVKLKVFEFAAASSIPAVCKAWHRGMSRILSQNWWSDTPKSLNSTRSQMYHERSEGDRSYYSLFNALADHLSQQLTKIDSATAHQVHREFKFSISPRRIVVLQEQIVYLRCMRSVWYQAQNQVAGLVYLGKNIRKICSEFLQDRNTHSFSKVRIIDMSSMSLTKIPPELVRFSHLEDLNLAQNDLKTIHLYLSYLPYLRRVDLRGNPFPQENYLSIARVIADHPTPTGFIIDIEPLKLVVSHQVDLAHSLKRVWKRIMSVFPEQIEGVYSNAKIKPNIPASQIRDLLRDRANRMFLDKITELDLKGCKIRALAPEIFLALRRLKKVDLSHNTLRELPYDEMEALEELEYLDLSHTDFSQSEYNAIGERLADFPALTTVIHHSPQFKFQTILNLKKKSSSMKQKQTDSGVAQPGGSKTCAIL